MLDVDTIEREVANGGSFEFYFNLADVDPIPNSEAKYYADDDLYHISEQHACSDRCQHTFKRRGAERSADKMLSVLRENLREAERLAASYARSAQRMQRDIATVESGNLNVTIYS
jgi:hypothetical protein